MIRIRHVALAAFCTGLFCALMIADPIIRLVEVAQ